ncbi:MAG: TDP-N-acetylfucosamine:lipid II N-acetylfucosaminyltransferase [Eubacteriales bacterium]|nr:TDP-N-acetylfucosamine:lipid II N-acetylfucosaminyltransferase [Eubacteriales bacterium]
MTEHKKLNIHMLGISMYTKDLYEMLNIDFDGKNNIFATGNTDRRFYSLRKENFFSNPVETGKPTHLFSPRFFCLLYASNKVFFHGLFSFARVVFFFFQPWLWKKCYWIVWGGDLYSARKSPVRAADKIKEWMKKQMIPRLAGVITLTEGDQQLVKDWYGFSGKFYQTSYPIPLQSVGMKERLANRMNLKKEWINIVIGNSATVTNQHMEVLDKLSKFKDQNIHIYIPLAYGNGEWKAYSQKVCDYAYGIFSRDKVTPIIDRMSGEEYTEFMRKMHIAIYNNNRQQAMGNIAIMLAVGAKVYIRTDTTMWDHYQLLNQKLYDVMKIDGMSFEEFIDYPEEEYKYNFDVLYERNDRQKIVAKWKNIL